MGLLDRWLTKRPARDDPLDRPPSDHSLSPARDSKTAPAVASPSAAIIAHPFCPHCGAEVSPPPKTKRKCPSCQEVIVPRTLLDGTKALLTPDQAVDLDREKAELKDERLLVNRLEALGVSAKERHDIEAKLQEQWGSPPSRRDVAWTAGNRKIEETSARGDFQALSGVYAHMARQLYDEGKDPFEVSKLSKHFELLALQRTGLPFDSMKLRVLGLCPESRVHEDSLYTIEEALEEMPIPRPDCSHDQKPGGFGICICSYINQFDFD